jgi:LacI family transcriptional regulator
MERPLTIGLLMDFMIPAIIEGTGAYARQHGMRLDARWSVRADWMPGRPEWDGVLVYLIDMENAHRRAMELGLPMVHLSGWLGRRALPRVECDFAACGMLAVEEFRRIGLPRVAGLAGWRSGVDWRSLRGVRAGAARAGLEFLQLVGPRRGIDWMKEIRRLADDVAELEFPLGLFCPHAGAAFSLIGALEERQVRVPDDVALIVIDKDPQRTAELASVPLTAVVPDFWQQGYEAAGILHRALKGGFQGRSILRVPPAKVVRRESTGVAGSRDPMVAKALHLLGEPAGRNSGVAELARLVGVSRRTLETRFRRETGMTLHGAQIKSRMEEAKRRLRNTGHTLSEVASECGFSTVHYFTTAFKREVGMTPGVYRKGKQQARGSGKARDRQDRAS